MSDHVQRPTDLSGRSLNQIDCPQCGESVMATAPACPSCGEKVFVEHPGGITPTKHPPIDLPEAEESSFGPSDDRVS